MYIFHIQSDSSKARYVCQCLVFKKIQNMSNNHPPGVQRF